MSAYAGIVDFVNAVVAIVAVVGLAAVLWRSFAEERDHERYHRTGVSALGKRCRDPRCPLAKR